MVGYDDTALLSIFSEDRVCYNTGYNHMLEGIGLAVLSGLGCC